MSKVTGQDMSETVDQIIGASKRLRTQAEQLCIDGEKTQMAQCLEIAQNAAVRLLTTEALIDEAIQKLAELGNRYIDHGTCAGTLHKDIANCLDSLADYRCPSCKSDNTGGTADAEGNQNFTCLDCGAKYSLATEEPPLVLTGKMPKEHLPEGHPDK